MLTIVGKLENLFTKAEYLDKSSGEVVPAKLYLQVMGKFPQENGDFRFEMKDIKADISTFETIKTLKDKQLIIPVSPFAPRNSTDIYYSIPKGLTPTLAPSIERK